MSPKIQGFLLWGIGGAVLLVSSSDIYLRYVKSSMHPFLLASGVILVFLGATTSYMEHRDAAAKTANEARLRSRFGPAIMEKMHAHSHGPGVAWLLLLPVLAVVFINPPALGEWSAIHASPRVNNPQKRAFTPLTARDPVKMTLAGYAQRAVWDETATLQGRSVKLTGFAVVEGDSWYLTRLAVACCAADALTSKILIQGDTPPAKNGDWFEVIGTWVPTPKDGENAKVAILQATSIQSVPEPRRTYERSSQARIN